MRTLIMVVMLLLSQLSFSQVPYSIVAQATSGWVGAGDSATTGNLSVPGNAPVALLVVGVSWRSQSKITVISSLTDTFGTNFEDSGAGAVRSPAISQTYDVVQTLYAFVPLTGNTTDQITAEFSTDILNANVSVLEVTGFSQGQLGGFSYNVQWTLPPTNPGDGNNIITPTLNSVGYNDLLVGTGVAVDGNITCGTVSQGGQTYTASMGGVYFEYINQPEPAPVRAAWNDPIGHDQYSAILVDFVLQ